ncbi:MAG TPA: hypothetical protein VFW93_08660 [Aquabacterium sp.]|uniref:hypothetical protein n=1 Tax=Aquabacterium sp. TaxID=1872578 RepID=UPI002E2EE020|nr:hypothetical protein [Aquabacterium sp.]HEX5356277.1 hypothetical protein [Aquabacterium sp.]
MKIRLSALGLRAVPLAALWMALSAHAASYYVSTSGDNAGLGTEQQPWRTLDKVNGKTFNSGDVVYLRAGDVFEGTLRLQSGVKYSSFPVGAGTAVKPVIRGSVHVGGLNWTPEGGNVWVADASSVLVDDKDAYGNVLPAGISQLYLNGERLARARFPYAGGGVFKLGANRYLRAVPLSPNTDAYSQTLDATQSQSLDDGTAPTLAALLADKDLQGAQAFVKNNDWFMGRYKISTSLTSASTTLVLEDDGPESAACVADRFSGACYTSNRYSARALDWPGVRNQGISKNYGFWLEGKRWMLHNPGEWVYEPATRKLYIMMAAGASPVGAKLTASVRLHAITGYQITSVDIDNIEVRETRSDAIMIDGARQLASLSIASVRAYQAGRKGINIMATQPSSTPVGSITNTIVEGSINEGIDLSGDRRWADTRSNQISVTNSVVRGAGMSYYARGALLLGHRGDALNNTIENSGYIGLHGGKINTISGNVVRNSCMAFDDCGAIYISGSYYNIKDEEPSTTDGPYAVRASITGNTVIGNLASDNRLDGSFYGNGLGDGARHANDGGIYLDDYASGVDAATPNVVSGNYVEGVNHAFTVHHGSFNLFERNEVSACRKAMFMQENLDTANVLMQGNTVRDNVFATSSSDALVKLDSTAGQAGRTANLATFSNNRYASYRATVFAEEDNGLKGVSPYKTFAQWQASGRDTAASGGLLRATGFGIRPASGATQMLPNGVFSSSTGGNGWYSDKNTYVEGPAPGGNALSIYPARDYLGKAASCPVTEVGWCNFFVSPGIRMTIEKGQSYWLTFDAKVDVADATRLKDVTPAPLARMELRFAQIDGPWQDLTPPAVLVLSKRWQSFSRLIKVPGAVTDVPNTLSGATLATNFFMDPVYVNKPAYLAAGGFKVSVANFSLTKAELVQADAGPKGMVNTSDVAASKACPNANAALCNSYVDLRTGAAVSFPLSLPAHSSKVLVTTHPLWVDKDRDGIPGDTAITYPSRLDVCTSTGDGLSVKENGCALN